MWSFARGPKLGFPQRFGRPRLFILLLFGKSSVSSSTLLTSCFSVMLSRTFSWQLGYEI